MSEYTPTTEEIRSFYRGSSFSQGEQFDRWLAEVKAQAVWEFIDQTRKGNPTYWTESEREIKAQAWEEGYNAKWAETWFEDNPYRKGENK